MRTNRLGRPPKIRRGRPKQETLNVPKMAYREALERVIAVRTQRQKIYGDNWKELKDWELLSLIREKVRRITTFIIDKKSEAVYEKKVDTLIDLCNYTLFLLQNELDKEAK